VSAATLYVCTK